jgi:hypothetical protein
VEAPQLAIAGKLQTKSYNLTLPLILLKTLRKLIGKMKLLGFVK